MIIPHPNGIEPNRAINRTVGCSTHRTVKGSHSSGPGRHIRIVTGNYSGGSRGIDYIEAATKRYIIEPVIIASGGSAIKVIRLQVAIHTKLTLYRRCDDLRRSENGGQQG